MWTLTRNGYGTHGPWTAAQWWLVMGQCWKLESPTKPLSFSTEILNHSVASPRRNGLTSGVPLDNPPFLGNPRRPCVEQKETGAARDVGVCSRNFRNHWSQSCAQAERKFLTTSMIWLPWCSNVTEVQEIDPSPTHDITASPLQLDKSKSRFRSAGHVLFYQKLWWVCYTKIAVKSLRE